ncbi:MAG: hypothetical protein LUC98_02070 [Lachnospiraceae bacterium]|nr:hypothetical protein [Lachnospiraceae bacterium]
MNRLIYHILSGASGVRLGIRILTRQTARAFDVDAPKIMGRSAEENLRAYARFTANASTRALRSGQDIKVLRRKLYRMAYGLGSGLRRWMRPQNEQECLAIVTLLYRNIGIQISEETPGTFLVSRCYFSAFYTPELCSLISAIDQGIFAGIYRGGKLTFRQRITEGQDTCRATLRRVRKDRLL